MPTYIVEQHEAGLKALDFLQRKVPAAPPSYLKQLLKKGKISTNHGVLGAEQVLLAKEQVFLPDSGRLLELLAAPTPQPTAVEVLYETRDTLIVNKPAGLAIHSSQGHEQSNLTRQVEQLMKDRKLGFKCAPVHRLDLGTSGPVIFGKGKKACGQLGQLFMQQRVEKYYLGLVGGTTAGSGELKSSLKAKGKTKQAACRYRALLRSSTASLLEIELVTGRQHQIRQQFTRQGHPLFGDQRYNGPLPSNLKRIFLHCSRLSYVDPFSEVPVDIHSPLPTELEAFLKTLFTPEELAKAL